MNIKLSKKAAQTIQCIMKENELDPTKSYLRIGVKGGGCAGFSYVLDITESKKERDEETDQEGVKIVCDNKSLLYLEGTEIDYQDGLMGKGFVFNNPNATSQCGCGSSFNA